jgi:hypothetical protein
VWGMRDNYKVALRNSIISKMSVESVSQGISLAATHGAGKTTKAIQDFVAILERGWSACWITTQGERNSRILDYMPTHQIPNIQLWSPYKSHSKGFNWLATPEVGGAKACDDQIAGLAERTASMFTELFDVMSDNMSALLKIAVQAVKYYERETGEIVTLLDAVMFLKLHSFRTLVFRGLESSQGDYDEFIILTKAALPDPTNPRHRPAYKEESLNSVTNRLLSVVTTSGFKRALCYDAVDALKMHDLDQRQPILSNVDNGESERVLSFIADLKIHSDGIPDLGLTEMTAKIIAKALLIHFHSIALNRSTHNSVPYILICDEHYHYTSGLEERLEAFPDRYRQYRMPLYLIYQNYKQMSPRLLDMSARQGTSCFMQLDKATDKAISSLPEYRDLAGRLCTLPARQFYMTAKVPSPKDDNITEVRYFKGEVPPLWLPNESNYGIALGFSLIKEPFKYSWRHKELFKLELEVNRDMTAPPSGGSLLPSVRKKVRGGDLFGSGKVGTSGEHEVVNTRIRGALRDMSEEYDPIAVLQGI